MANGMTMPGRCARRAFSLLEVIFAMALLAVLVVGGLRLMWATGFDTARSGAQAQATRLLQSLAEECRSVPMADFEKFYATAGPGEAALDPGFYPVTLRKINEWQANTAATIRDFQASASIRLYRNSLGQITEIWFFPEIQWQERTGTKASLMNRHVRTGFLRTNPLAPREDK